MADCGGRNFVMMIEFEVSEGMAGRIPVRPTTKV
jgi:hypothetical protein